MQKYVREELITSQIREEIKKVSLPLDWLSWMIEENKKDQSSEIQSSTLFADSVKADISLLETKIEKLMNAYLESVMSLEEYRDAKNALVASKQLLKEKLWAFEQKANNRFELTEKFLKYNMELANGAWKILSDSEFFGGNAEVSALRADPISGSDSDFQFWRRGWDSNPRWTLAHSGFQDRRIQPLCHLSRSIPSSLRSHRISGNVLSSHR
jgi:hypothetical protein